MYYLSRSAQRFEAWEALQRRQAQESYGRTLTQAQAEAQRRWREDEADHEPEVEAEIEDEGGDEVPAPDLFMFDRDPLTPDQGDTFAAIEYPVVAGDVNTGMIAGLCFAALLFFGFVTYFAHAINQASQQEMVAIAEVRDAR